MWRNLARGGGTLVGSRRSGGPSEEHQNAATSILGDSVETSETGSDDQQRQALVEIAVESWRFARLFAHALEKMDPAEAHRYSNQLRFYLKRLEDALASADIRLVNLEGQQYDPGMAATALNLADFGADDQLFVGQMIEPVLMRADALLRAGTIMVRTGDK